jgi:nicotinamide mononucleotide transporter
MGLTSLVDWLTASAVHLWGVDITWAEVLANLLALASIWLAVRDDVWNWPLGILNGICFIVLFADVKLYANVFLQVVFIGLSAYGWWEWTARQGERQELLRIRRMRAREWVWLNVAGAAFGAAWVVVLARWTDSPTPLLDSLTMVVSVQAVYAQARKWLEAWWYWIAFNVVSIPLHVDRGLYPTAVLYGVFAAMSVLGLVDWTRLMRSGDERGADVAPAVG